MFSSKTKRISVNKSLEKKTDECIRCDDVLVSLFILVFYSFIDQKINQLIIISCSGTSTLDLYETHGLIN